MSQQAVIRKSSPVVVRPSTPDLTTGDIKLSFFDKGPADLPATSVFAFVHPIHKPAETIKSALSRALVHYYPFAGRLDVGADDGKLFIRCSGEGAVFVAAAANVALKEMEFLDRPLRAAAALDQLALDYPAERCGRGDPLLLMQVTEFACGGFVIGLTWNHVVADAAGLAQFVQAVGELARGLPAAPTVAPVRYDDSLPGIPPMIAAAGRTSSAASRDDGAPDDDDLVFLDVTIPCSLISRIKAKFSDLYPGSSKKPCTVFEAVAAVLWRCRTRAAMPAGDPEAPTTLSFMAGARKLVGAKHGYYGNCVSNVSVTATSGAVASGELMDIVKMVKQAKEEMVVKMPSQNKEDDAAAGGGGQPDKKPPRNMYNNLGLSCVRNLGLDEADFGSGKPARVMNRMPRIGLPICAACLPWEGKDGANVFSRCVKEEHAGAFLAELARFTA